MSVFVDIEKTPGSFHLKVRFEAGNETLALLGASGSGKSMTLKCIAGIEKPDRGRIVVDDVVLFDSEKHINLPPQQRHTGLMFQNYALFPNMTVLQNIRAGAGREPDKRKREAAVTAIMDSFGLTPWPGTCPPSCPAACSSARRSRAPWCWTATSFCWMSPFPRWTRW